MLQVGVNSTLKCNTVIYSRAACRRLQFRGITVATNEDYKTVIGLSFAARCIWQSYTSKS